jgi:hypothetical protein
MGCYWKEMMMKKNEMRKEGLRKLKKKKDWTIDEKG